MKAIAILSLCSAAALASARPPPDPAPKDPSLYRLQEDLQVKNLYVRKEVNGASFKVTSVNFELINQDNTLMKCSNDDYEPLNRPNNVLKSGYCKDPKYTFVLLRNSQEGGDKFTLSVSHETAPAYGFSGDKVVPTYCQAGGLGTTDRICKQVEPVVYITIKDPFSHTNP